MSTENRMKLDGSCQKINGGIPDENEDEAMPLSPYLPDKKTVLWKNRLDDALRYLDDRSALNRNPLSRLSYAKRLADRKYQDKIMPAGLALREWINISIDRIAEDVSGDAGLSRLSTYLICAKEGLNRRQTSERLGLSREHVSREIRPRALELLADVMQQIQSEAAPRPVSLVKV
jgi:hypothetical protein